MFFLLPFIVLANNVGKEKYKYEKEKKIKKEYTVDANALLDIDTKYGNINVTTWNENRVVIDVVIKVSGNNEDKVNKHLKKINVAFSGSRSIVSAHTVIDKKKSSWSWSWGNSGKVNYEINYTIKAPKSAKADLNIDYGNISVNELDGRAILTCDYGNISTGDLNHENNRIDLDYGKANISYIRGGNINIDYSKIDVIEADNVSLNADYTASVFEKIKKIKYVCDYGSLKVHNAETIIGEGDYLTTRLGTISKNISLIQDYGSVRIEKLGVGFESVNLKGDYCSFKIGIPDTSFSFELDLGYAGFKYGNSGYDFTKKIIKSSSKYYEGTFKGGSKSNIKITSDYGSVKFESTLVK